MCNHRQMEPIKEQFDNNDNCIVMRINLRLLKMVIGMLNDYKISVCGLIIREKKNDSVLSLCQMDEKKKILFKLDLTKNAFEFFKCDIITLCTCINITEFSKELNNYNNDGTVVMFINRYRPDTLYMVREIIIPYFVYTSSFKLEHYFPCIVPIIHYDMSCMISANNFNEFIQSSDQHEWFYIDFVNKILTFSMRDDNYLCWLKKYYLGHNFSICEQENNYTNRYNQLSMLKTLLNYVITNPDIIRNHIQLKTKKNFPLNVELNLWGKGSIQVFFTVYDSFEPTICRDVIAVDDDEYVNVGTCVNRDDCIGMKNANYNKLTENGVYKDDVYKDDVIIGKVVPKSEIYKQIAPGIFEDIMNGNGYPICDTSISSERTPTIGSVFLTGKKQDDGMELEQNCDHKRKYEDETGEQNESKKIHIE